MKFARKKSFRRGIILISFLCLLSCSERKDWGSISVGKDADGHLEAVLENSKIRVRYGYFKGPHIDETVIKEFIIKGADENQAGRSLDACARRGVLTKAEIKADGPKVKTVHLEFDGGEKQQDVSIYPNSTYIKIDYIDAGINIVDIGDPGGSTGEWVIYAADKWKREIVGYPKVYFDRNPDDVGKEPFGLDEVDTDGGSLDYKGWFIMGIYNQDNLRGYGRIVPVKDIDVIKLLFANKKQGFEFCTHEYIDANRKAEPFTGYLYAVTGGVEEIISMGKKLADGVVAP